MFGIPIAVILGVVALAATVLGAPSVAAFHRFVAYVHKKLGVTIPDNPTIDSDLEAVLKAVLPALVKALLSGGDAAAIAEAVKAAVESVLSSKAAPAKAAAPAFDPTKSVQG